MAISILIVFIYVKNSNAASRPVVFVSGVIATDTTWSSSNVYVVNGNLYIQRDATLTLPAGTIVKNAGNAEVIVEGTLRTIGTTSNLVVFTSFKDDSVGGDSNGDGPSTGTFGEYQSAIRVEGGALDVGFTTFRNATYSIYSNTCSEDSLKISDSAFNSTIYIRGCAKSDEVSLVRNRFFLSQAPAIITSRIELSGISLSGINRNSFTGSGQGRVIKINDGSYVLEGKTWDVSGASGAVVMTDARLTVYGTVNLQSGSIVKFNYPIDVHGVLNVDGTSTSKAYLTSFKDDSVGGDSNGDGPSSYSWNDYQSGVLSSSGSINIRYALGRGGEYLINSSGICSSGRMNIEDSHISSTLYLDSCGDTGKISAKRNTFTGSQTAAMKINGELSDIAMYGPDANIFNGAKMGKTVQLMTNVRIDSDKSWAISGLTKSTIVVNSAVYIYGELKLAEGSVVKVATTSSGVWPQTGGRVKALGSSSKPVTFTSYKDDSVGGDSNGDGTMTLPNKGDYEAALYSSLSSVISVENAQFKYGRYAVEGRQIANLCPQSGNVEIADSTLSGGINLAGCGSHGSIALKRNTFNVQDVFAVALKWVDVTGIILRGQDSNTFNGSPLGRSLYIDSGTIESGKEWNVGGENGSTIYVYNNFYNYGSFNLGPGTLVKVNGGQIQQYAGSSMTTAGSSTNPVTFTSYKDDSVGGDSNGDGNTNASMGDYLSALKVETNSSVNLNHTNIRYANYGLFMEGGDLKAENSQINTVRNGIYAQRGSVIFRGSIYSTENRIAACVWSSQACSVDAAFTDWGSASGPDINGQDPEVCGKVQISPWRYEGATFEGQGVFTPNCNGSQVPAESLNTSISSYQDAVSIKNIDCNNGYQDACQAAHDAFVCLSGAVNTAGSLSPFPIPEIEESGQIESFGAATADSARTYLVSQAAQQASGSSFAGDILGVVDLFMQLKKSYDNCAP